MPDPVAPAVTAAGIVKTPGVDDVLERVEAAIDGAEFKAEFFTGRELDSSEIQRRRLLLTRIAREVNIRLAGRVVLLGGWPELRGFGARFEGRDSDGREYMADFRHDDEMRMAHAPDDAERFVREVIDMLTTEILAQRARYLHRMTGEQTGTA